MSLINQVLNQLEARGEHTAPDQTQIRPVPTQARRDWSMPVLILLLLALLLGVAAWLLLRQPTAASAGAPAVPATPALVAVAPAAVESAPTAAPVNQLSYELSVPPLPDALREPSPVAATMEPQRPLVAAIEPEAPVVEPVRPPVPAAPVVRSAPPVKQISPQQRADAAYRKGLQAQYQRLVPEALAAYEAALRDDPAHEGARLALVNLLQGNGQLDAAEKVLRQGMTVKPLPHSFIIALARLQLAQGDLTQAQHTLHSHLQQAADDADYQAFYAAVLQRGEQHGAAVDHYRAALKLTPRNGMWCVGLAISLQALARKEEARQAYEQALATRSLSPEQTAFVQQRLAAL